LHFLGYIQNRPTQGGIVTPAQKELIMLWILLSANANRSPASGLSAAQILSSITANVRTALNNPAWNWPGFGLAHASGLITAAVNREGAGGSGLGPYGSVLLDFRAATPSAPPWSGGNDHPSAAELVVALGIQ
jgi:hypothetical protein